MDPIAPFIRVIIVLLGIAFPVLFQVVSRLDDKYSSDHIVELFSQEKERKLFYFFLISSLLSVLVWAFAGPRVFDLGCCNWIVDDSAVYFVYIFSSLLVIFFFLFIQKILIYSTPNKFIKYLIKKYNAKNEFDLNYFQAISDVFYFSIRNQNISIASTVSEFMYEQFKKEREKSNKIPVEYPFAFYLMISKSAEELAILKSKRLLFLENRVVGGEWLLGGTGHYKISTQTYFSLWNNLLKAIQYDNDDMVLEYWKTADQYFRYYMEKLGNTNSAFDNDEEFTQEQIEERESERREFLNFNYALGGLLMYKEKYNCIRRMWDFTNSFPPTYELLPKSMTELFNLFVKFEDRNNITFFSIHQQFKFPDMEGLTADSKVKGWILKYFSVLFLRQYELIPYDIYTKPLALPHINPRGLNEKERWVRSIEHFEAKALKVYKDEDLKSKLKFEKINDEWCEINSKRPPSSIFNETKIAVNNSFNNIEVNQLISPQKVESFKKKSFEILDKVLTDFQEIQNEEIVKNNFTSRNVFGIINVDEKSVFSENPLVYTVDFETYLAAGIRRNIIKTVSETFVNNRSFSYLLSPEIIFQAVDKLGISSNEYLLISVGINIDFFKSKVNLPSLSEHKYKDFQIISLKAYDSRTVESSLFVLRKSDLPSLFFTYYPKDKIEKYKLTKLHNIHEIYASVIDLNTEENLRNETRPPYNEADLRRYVLVCLGLNFEIRWKNNIKLVQLKLFSEYSSRGLRNELNEVSKLE